jgi:hypothetical protein
MPSIGTAVSIERYRTDNVIAPSGTSDTHPRVHENGQIEINDLLKPTFRQLAVLRNLETNWDGEGGRPVSVFTIAKAISLFPEIVCMFYRVVQDAIRPYDVAPMGDGGVQLEWRGPYGILQLEVHADGTYAYLLIEGEGENRRFEEADNIRSSNVKMLLSRIFQTPMER